ncbi:hypothetical protein CC78DRAFT_616191 [Lojkania enalia]|uniref:Uncharacterized protein n=1 Tax=Lojkania enalia TaxID=147567 RepID=A0A9P4KCB4_9PLEO|nr:hypothetical protein CC78DRAFT_616191 [Didymosphaeria enalia]
MAMLNPTLHSQAILILWGSINSQQTDEARLNRWWTHEHLPERLALPGFNRARRYCSAAQDGTRKYLACYEVSELEDLKSDAYMHSLNTPTLMTEEFMPCLAAMNRLACSVIRSRCSLTDPRVQNGALGNRMSVVVFLPPPETVESENDFITRIAELFWYRALSHPDVLSFNLLRHDEEVSRVGSTSKSYYGVGFKGQDVPPLSAALEIGEAGKEFCRQITTSGAREVSVMEFQLLCSMDSSASAVG